MSSWRQREEARLSGTHAAAPVQEPEIFIRSSYHEIGRWHSVRDCEQRTSGSFPAAPQLTTMLYVGIENILNIAKFDGYKVRIKCEPALVEVEQERTVQMMGEAINETQVAEAAFSGTQNSIRKMAAHGMSATDIANILNVDVRDVETVRLGWPDRCEFNTVYGTVSVFLLEDPGRGSLQIEVLGVSNSSTDEEVSDADVPDTPTESMLGTYEYTLGSLAEKAQITGCSTHATIASEKLAWRLDNDMIVNIGLEMCTFAVEQHRSELAQDEDTHDELSFADVMEG